MPEQNKNGVQCAEFEALLSDALDGALSGQKLESFQTHARSCAVCGPLFANAKSGQRWLKSLGEVEPPVNLVHNILAATTGQETKRLTAVMPLQPSWWDQFRTSVLAPVVAVARQPRFAMSFGMAFFSLTVVMNMAGVKLSDVRHADLRPSAIRRSYYETSGKVVKYYENLRFVYEIESRMREFKRVTAPVEPRRKETERERKNNTSEQPEQKQERNSSQRENQPILAAAPDGLPIVPMTTSRRLV